jgi:multicomponent K+:H+ antiporter subunit A
MTLAGIATPRPSAPVPTGGWAERHPAMLTAAARVALPLALLLAVFLLLRGHDLPGGGFAAGVLAAVALYLQRVARGRTWADARRRVPAPALIAGGVLVTTLTGTASLLAGRPFLTSYYEKVSVPLIGKVPVSSALAFDIGVMLAVVGAILLVLERLGAVDDAVEDDTVRTPATADGPEVRA